MSLHQTLTFQATFKQGQLIIVDHSPDLPAFFSGHTQLLVYLNRLTATSLKVKQMAFEGFDLIVEMERTDNKRGPTPQYLVNILAQTLASDDHTPTDFAARLAQSHQALNEDFAESMRRKGWRELAVSNALEGAAFDGVYIISIWSDQ